MSQRHRKQWYFVYLPESPITLRSPTDHPFEHMVVNSRGKWSILMWVSLICTECAIGIDEKLYQLYIRIPLRLLLNESIKCHHSVALYSNHQLV